MAMEPQRLLNLPFNLPVSLQSYATQYDSDPDKAIRNLTTFLKKRGSDAVGHFLLSWLYHLEGRQQEAITYALEARSYAPGSPLLEHIHFYLVHPRQFEAKIPVARSNGEVIKKPKSPKQGSILDLDRLIAQLSEAENKKIQIIHENSSEDLSKYSEDTDEIATLTLAKIYEGQGKLEAALQVYTRLKKSQSADKKEIKQHITRLKKLLTNKS